MQITRTDVRGIALEDELRRIVAEVSAERYGGNVILDHVQGNPPASFKLRTTTSKGPGARRSWSGRRLPAACWHAHRDVLRAIFARFPKARITTAMADYNGAEGFERAYPATGSKNIGSMMQPAYMPDLCECAEFQPGDYGTTTFGTLHPDGTTTNVRVLRQADMLACPHVIMVPEHYRDDGTCRCNDAQHTEMAEWGYYWTGKSWDSPDSEDVDDRAISHID